MKEPIPKIELDISDVSDIQTLSKEELSMVPCDKRKWLCCVNECSRFTSVNYYGPNIPVLWRGNWVDLESSIFFCGKHWKLYKSNGRTTDTFDMKPGPGLNHLL